MRNYAISKSYPLEPMLSDLEQLRCSRCGRRGGGRYGCRKCVDNDLIAQCPPVPTMPSLEADSAAECSNSGSGSGDTVEASTD